MTRTLRKLLIAAAAASALGGASVPAVADQTPNMEPQSWCDLFPRLCERKCGGSQVPTARCDSQPA